MNALILGSGYTGSALAAALEGNSHVGSIFETKRTPAQSQIYFCLEDSESWKNLPQADLTFWLFAASSRESVKKFLDHKRNSLGRVIAVSSTGFFLTHEEHEIVTEETPVDLQNPRVQAEEELRSAGAVILHAAGIYGPRRNPLDWLRSGRVRPSSKFVNMVHVEDLVQFILACNERALAGSRYIACDNHPHTWQELFDFWKDEYRLTPPPLEPHAPARSSKRVKNQKSLDELQIKLKYPNIKLGVQSLAQART